MPDLGQVVDRAVIEPGYRAELFANFDRAVEGYSLAPREAELLRGMTPEKLQRVVGAMVAHYFVPIRAGRRVITIPAGRVDITPAPEDAPVWLLPRGSFGNGTHPTTQIAVGALEDLLRPGDDVLDLGTGCGILVIAAARLGARSALGLDLSEAAAETAQRNIQINGVEALASAETGSLASLLDHRFGQPDPTFDLVIANILTPVIVDFLQAGVVRLLRPGGRLVVSGILDTELPQIERALVRSGLRLAGRYRTRTAWIGLVLKPSPPWSTLHRFIGGLRCLLKLSTRL